MNGDYLLAERLIEVFRKESRQEALSHAHRYSCERIANAIQRLLDEYNPPKKVTDRDV